jgi:hypothetical protein
MRHWRGSMNSETEREKRLELAIKINKALEGVEYRDCFVALFDAIATGILLMRLDSKNTETEVKQFIDDLIKELEKSMERALSAPLEQFKE